VTGAARGLGRDLLKPLLRQALKLSWQIFYLTLCNKKRKRYSNKGLNIHAVTVDLANADSIENAVAKSVEVLQGLDGLVNCAALATNVGGKNLIDYDPELWDRVMNINVKGTWLITKACVPHLKQSTAGKIINVASDTALWGAPNLMAYVASKGAIVAMTRSMARELGQFNICVNTFSPGLLWLKQPSMCHKNVMIYMSMVERFNVSNFHKI
jgi:NAD(P)-dependent dehydrogenase (short-subunit alcohol dehydrogenase family)